jgi:signal transduction histidine kinase
MSLKTRLRISIVVLAVGVVTALSALTLESVASAKFQDLEERASSTALQVQGMLVERLNQRIAERPQPETFSEQKELWAQIIREDEEFSRFLQDTLASSRTVLEIQVVTNSGTVLSSSDPVSVGTTATPLASLTDWGKLNPWRQLAGVFTRNRNYAVMMPLGLGDTPIFQARIIISTVLLRNTLEPLVTRLLITLSISFLAAVLLAILASNLAFRPLARLSDAIDRIARGEPLVPATDPKSGATEVAALESKLQLLGQQFHGAREDAVELRGGVERLLERLEEAVLLFDRDDRLIMAGRAVESILDKGRWELMGKSIEELFPGSTALGAAVSSAVGFRRSLQDFPVAVDREGRAAVRLLVNVELLESFPGRERIGTVVSLRDAETRREIGTQLDLSTRLAAISRLTGGVAHEIKNPLNSIALHLEVLKAKLEGSDYGAETEIEVISKEITRLDRVVKTFLDFTKPVELHFDAVEAVELAREIATLMAPEAARRGVELIVEADPAPIDLRADRDLLKQALLNVVVNGVEAMREGGELHLVVRRLAGECVFAIRDGGAGIPAELREKIFNLYFTTKAKGSGIGLAMSFRVVQLHSGTIDFSSETGRGTTFWLRFPLAEAAEAENDRVKTE